MTDRKRETRKKIIKEIFKNGGCSAARLAERIGVSRTTVLKEIASLCGAGAVAKSGSEYCLCGSAALVILKTGEMGGELCAFSFDGRIISKQSLEFSSMLSYGQNLVSAAEIADRYSDFLKKSYSPLVLCHACDANPASYPLPDIFSVTDRWDALVARSIGESYGEGSCIFVSKKSGRYLLCAQGKAISSVGELKDDSFERICSHLSLFPPDKLVIEGELEKGELECLIKVCKENRVELSCLNVTNTLSTDEREMLFEALLSLT